MDLCLHWRYLVCHFLQSADVGLCQDGVVGIIDDEARGSAGGLFDIFSLEIIDLDLVLIAAAGVPGGEGGRLLKRPVRDLVHGFSAGAEEDVRAGHIIGVEPDVAAVRHPEGDLFILKIVFSNINIIAVAADVMERPALGRAGPVHLAAAVLPGIFAAQVAAFLHFLPDLGEIRVCRGEFEGVLDAPEVVDLSLHLFCQTGQGLAGPFHAGITVKILFCVLLRREGGIEGDRHLLAGIIVVDLAAFFSRGDGVAVGIQEFSVQPVFVLFFRVPDLPALEVIFVDIPLQDRLHDVAEVLCRMRVYRFFLA